MSHRANFVWLENEDLKIYYSSMGALYSPQLLAQGFLFCKEYFKEFHEHGWLMDNAWAEGGILIDVNKFNVLVFGGEDVDWTPALQRHYIKRIKKIWNNWNVEWCSKGICDFAEYLGIMKERILSEGCEPNFKELDPNLKLSFSAKKNRTQDEVVTIICNNEVIDYKLDWGLDGIDICISKGESLKDIFPVRYKIVKWRNEVETTDCMLVDYDLRHLFVCWGKPRDDRHIEATRDIWKNWEVTKQTEGLRFHFDYTNRNFDQVELTDGEFEKKYLFLFKWDDDK